MAPYIFIFILAVSIILVLAFVFKPSKSENNVEKITNGDDVLMSLSSAALFVAIDKGNEEEAVKALEAGAVINAVSGVGIRALGWAKHKGYTEMVKLLEAAGAIE